MNEEMNNLLMSSVSVWFELFWKCILEEKDEQREYKIMLYVSVCLHTAILIIIIIIIVILWNSLYNQRKLKFDKESKYIQK